MIGNVAHSSVYAKPKGFCKTLKDSRDITIFVRPPFPPKFLAFHSALPIDVYLAFALLPAILHYFSSTYQLSYVSIRKPRCIDSAGLGNIRQSTSSITFQLDICLPYRYITKFIGYWNNAKWPGGGERQNIRQKAMKSEGTLWDFVIFHDFQS